MPFRSRRPWNFQVAAVKVEEVQVQVVVQVHAVQVVRGVVLRQVEVELEVVVVAAFSLVPAVCFSGSSCLLVVDLLS